MLWSVMTVMTRQQEFGRWFRERFPEAVREPTAFARAHDLSHVTVLNYVAGRTAPRKSDVREIARKLGVDEDELWAVAGFGQPPAVTHLDVDRDLTMIEKLSIAAITARELLTMEPRQRAALEQRIDPVAQSLVTLLVGWAQAVDRVGVPRREDNPIAEALAHEGK